MAYDINGRAYDPNDDADMTIVKAVGWAVAAILAIAFVGGCVSCQPQEAPVQEDAVLAVDTSNVAQMHRYGMPTKADCMEWHMHGQWGWMDGGKLMAFDELPGDSRAWDALYGIDSDNPAFDK